MQDASIHQHDVDCQADIQSLPSSVCFSSYYSRKQYCPVFEVDDDSPFSQVSFPLLGHLKLFFQLLPKKFWIKQFCQLIMLCSASLMAFPPSTPIIDIGCLVYHPLYCNCQSLPKNSFNIGFVYGGSPIPLYLTMTKTHIIAICHC